MNPATAELVLQLMSLAENAYLQIRTLIEREKSGNPLSDAEIADLKASSDSAHAIIQGWKPGAGV